MSVRTMKHRPMSAICWKMHNWLRAVATNYMKFQIGVRI
jgi:hypothetical protein